MNLIDIIERAAKEKPKKVFTKYNGQKTTFLQFKQRVKKFSAGLMKMGIKKGDKVALLLNNSNEFLIAYFAAVNAGAIAVPLNTFLRLEEVVYILNDSKVKVFVVSSDFNCIMENFSLSRASGLERVIGIGDVKCEKCVDFSSMYGEEEAATADISDNDTAVIIYTSGTTGYPKGAMLSHKNLISNAEGGTKAIHIMPSDRFILFLPMFHAFTFTVCVVIPIYRMCSLTIIKSIQPFTNIVKALIKDQITVFVAIPQVYNVLGTKNFGKFGMFIYNMACRIRVCVSGAAPLAGEVLKNFEEKFKTPLIEGYGLSEASPVVSVNPLDGIRKPGSVGMPIPGVEAKILDEQGKEVVRGETGEIAVKGPNVMQGYYNREEETKEMIKDGWLMTGDIGKMDEDNYIFIVDRKKDLILVNGMNLYPREIEEILYTHPAVEDAAVVGVKDKAHGEMPVGVIKLREGHSVGEIELKKFLRPHLANYKVPHRFEFWDDLPRTGTGKVLKREIRKVLNEKQEN